MLKINTPLDNASYKTKKYFKGKIIIPYNQRLLTISGSPESQ